MKIEHDVPAAALEVGCIVLWGAEELYFVAETVTPCHNGLYGEITLQEQDGSGYKWVEHIYLPRTYTMIRP